MSTGSDFPFELPLRLANAILRRFNLTPTSDPVDNGPVRYWDTRYPFQSGIVVTVHDGHVHLRNLAEALRDRNQTIDEFIDALIEAMQEEGIMLWRETPD